MFRLIKCLHNNSNTSLIVRIFSIVTIKISYSLLLIFSGKPVSNKILNLANIHKLYIVYMSILLSFDHYIRWDAFITHSFGIRFMIFARFINFVSHSGRRQTIIAFNLRRMYSFTLQFLFLKPVIKRNMGSIADELSIQTVDTFSIWTMLTQHFSCTYSILQVHSRTIETFSVRSMITFRFLGLCFFIFFSLITYSHAVQALTSRRMIALRSNIAFSE